VTLVTRMEETADHIQSLITADDMKDLFNAGTHSRNVTNNVPSISGNNRQCN
jgi:hypothetical protein